MAGSAWATTTLGEVIELKRGYDLPSRNRRVGPFPIVSSSGVSGYHVEAKANAPGVVTGRYGTLGEVHYITQDFWPLNTSLYIRDFKGNDPRFISYFLRSLDFTAYSDKAAVPGLNRNDLHTAVVRIPPVGEQRAIAHILGTLDDKIELNRRTNETLEAIARALFKSWFVDFDPVRAKSEGRDPGLPAPLADLFPDSFEASELGEIPKGWRVGKAGELAVLTRDACTPGNFPEETFDHFSIPAFDDGRMPKVESGASIKSNKFLVQAESVLVSKLNPRIPRTWMPTLEGSHRAVCSTEFLVALPRAGVSREFLFCLFSSDAFTGVFETLVSGTSGSHQRVKPEDLLMVDVAVPPRPVLEEFTNIVGPILARVGQALAESGSLAVVRGTLLPKLISGELRVGYAEQLLAEASR